MELYTLPTPDRCAGNIVLGAIPLLYIGNRQNFLSVALTSLRYRSNKLFWFVLIEIDMSRSEDNLVYYNEP